MGILWFSVWILFSWYIVMLPSVHPEEVTVKDDEIKDWFGQRKELKKTSGESWVVKENIVYTCGIGTENDFWLITPYIDLSESIAEVINVDVEAELTLCDDPGAPKGSSSRLKCFSNYFEVYIYRGNIEETSPDLNYLTERFQPLYNITNDTSPNSIFTRRIKTFSFPQNHSQGVTFAIRSRGACGSIFKMKMYYYYCKEIFINGLQFVNTTSPAKGFKTVQTTAKTCSNNSVKSINAAGNKTMTLYIGYCFTNGTWSIPQYADLRCLCREGYTLTDGLCAKCKSNTYKSSIGNEICIPCPKNSVSEKGQTQCRCNYGFYRLKGKNYEHPCYGIPSEVWNIIVLERTETTITLQWQQPEKQYQGAVYEIECNKCPSSNDSATCEEQCGRSVTFIPSQTDLKYTNVTIQGLDQNTEYQFVIYSKNKYSDRINKTNWRYSVKKIKKFEECKSNTYKLSIENEKCTPCPNNSASEKGQTQCHCNDGFYRLQGENYEHPCYGIPSEVRNIIVLERTETTITLQWQQPQKQYEDTVYEIECNKCPSSNDSAPCEEQCGRSVTFIPSQTDLKYTNVTIQGLDQNTEYQFAIYSKNKYSDRINKTNWRYSMKKMKTFEVDEGDLGGSNDKSKTPEMLGIGIGVASFFLIIIVVVILVFRRRRSAAQKSQSWEGDVNAKNNVRNSLRELKTLHNRNLEVVYVHVLKDWEISPNDLKVLDKNLGAGQFGVVKQGLYTPQNGEPEKVAIKMLKENASESELLDLLAEIKVLKEANKEKHPNIIKFIGSCFMKGRRVMVTEFCPGGNLRKFLIKSRINDNSSDSHNIYVNITSTLSDRQLLKLAVDVACGMVHLSSRKFLHRDLAARNILLGEENVAKICDFGLARDVGSAEKYIRNTQNLLPVKWMSVESLFDGVFTTASDVWSFGVLLYEIATLGEEPYKNIPARAVITHVESGGRMSKPPHCSNEVYEIMSNCWKVDPKERPTFPEILRALRDMLNDREHTYINVSQVKQ
ncbi:ephrin type-B receptor 1-B-like isoform X2 [Dendronephthya gigantea]|uniref:ephrin type-B receptor 1-B-like isoform X2 n=1 Tax=Dendronephthya gigantea TaxID=151771 RepID=UPI0010695662|nr:ephrin type-B receptor 1-B-like isoform X2 [Dendronephthya gigantea]